MGLVPKKIDAALRSQVVRLVTEHRAEYSSERALHIQVAVSLGVSREPVRRWVMQYEVDAGQAAGGEHGRAGGTAQAASGERTRARGQRSAEGGDDSLRAGAHHNALMKTINGLYKAECIRTKVFHDGLWRPVSDVEYATASWVEWHDNLGCTEVWA